MNFERSDLNSLVTLQCKIVCAKENKKYVKREKLCEFVTTQK